MRVLTGLVRKRNIHASTHILLTKVSFFGQVQHQWDGEVYSTHNNYDRVVTEEKMSKCFIPSHFYNKDVQMSQVI